MMFNELTKLVERELGKERAAEVTAVLGNANTESLSRTHR